MDFATNAPLAAAMLAPVPVAFTLDLDAGVVYEQVQQAFRAAIGDADRKYPLPSTDGAEVRHGPAPSAAEDFSTNSVV